MRAFTGDIELDPATQLQAIGIAVVEPDREPVRTNGRMLGRRLLLDVERSDGLALRGHLRL